VLLGKPGPAERRKMFQVGRLCTQVCIHMQPAVTALGAHVPGSQLCCCGTFLGPYGHPHEPEARWLVPRFGIPSHNYCIVLY
jgi:hypothetical protein